MLSAPMTDTNLIYIDNNPDRRFELYRGRLVQQSIQTNLKNKICQFLLFKLQQYFAMADLPLITLFNVAVRTGADTSRVPDLVVCSLDLWKQVGDRDGAAIFNFGETPQLIIEVQTNHTDYLLKKAEYALAEIPEVWMVNPEQNRVRIWTNPTDEEGYQSTDYHGEETIVSPQFPNLDLTVADILRPLSYAELMQAEVDANGQLEEGMSYEWQQMALARCEQERLQEAYDDLAEKLHNELQEKSILLELLEEKGIDLRAELNAEELAMLEDDIQAREAEELEDSEAAALEVSEEDNFFDDPDLD